MQQAQYTGVNLRNAISVAQDLGCETRIARRTGELVVVDDEGNRVRVNSRRKDTPRAFSTFLNRLARREAGSGDADGSDPSTAGTAAAEQERQAATPEQADVVAVAEEVLVEVPDGSASSRPVVERPHVVGRNPLERLRFLRGMRDQIAAEAVARLTALESDRDLLKQMLGEADAEVEELRAELRDAGVTSAAVAAVTPLVPSPAGVPVTGGVTARLPRNARVYEFMSSPQNIGVWFPAGQIMERAGESGPVGQVLKPLVEAGKVEVRGQTRATQYRVPPT